MSSVMPWNRVEVAGDGAAGIDQAIEGFAGEDAAVDDAHPAMETISSPAEV